MLIAALAHRIASHPRLYNWIQNLAGQRRVILQLRAALEKVGAGRALDVGSAGGSVSKKLALNPLHVDVDFIPLLALRQRDRSASAVTADAAMLPFHDAAFDLTLCVDVSHHLDDTVWPEALTELSRVTRGRLIFLDAIRNDSRFASRMLWRYDRGRYPRAREELLDALSREFTIDETADFSIYHQYVLCIATPRPRAGIRSTLL
jgi:SAM-dependent methyltransferase